MVSQYVHAEGRALLELVHAMRNMIVVVNHVVHQTRYLPKVLMHYCQGVISKRLITFLCIVVGKVSNHTVKCNYASKLANMQGQKAMNRWNM